MTWMEIRSFVRHAAPKERPSSLETLINFRDAGGSAACGSLLHLHAAFMQNQRSRQGA
jgi:hypothetical protein